MADEKELAWLQHRYNLEYEMIRAIAAFEHQAIKPLFLLNGGALVAALALYGSENGKAVDIEIMKVAIFGWVIAVCLAACAVFCGAVSQQNFRKLRGTEAVQGERTLGLPTDSRTDDQLRKLISDFGSRGQNYRTCAVCLGFASMAIFLLALIPAFLAIR